MTTHAHQSKVISIAAQVAQLADEGAALLARISFRRPFFPAAGAARHTVGGHRSLSAVSQRGRTRESS